MTLSSPRSDGSLDWVSVSSIPLPLRGHDSLPARDSWVTRDGLGRDRVELVDLFLCQLHPKPLHTLFATARYPMTGVVVGDDHFPACGLAAVEGGFFSVYIHEF